MRHCTPPEPPIVYSTTLHTHARAGALVCGLENPRQASQTRPLLLLLLWPLGAHEYHCCCWWCCYCNCCCCHRGRRRSSPARPPSQDLTTAAQPGRPSAAAHLHLHIHLHLLLHRKAASYARRPSLVSSSSYTHTHSSATFHASYHTDNLNTRRPIEYTAAQHCRSVLSCLRSHISLHTCIWTGYMQNLICCDTVVPALLTKALSDINTYTHIP